MGHLIGLLLNSPPARWIGAALGAVVAFLLIIARARSNAATEAKNEVQHEYEAETARRVEAGRVALRDDSGTSPDDSVRENDSRWQ